MADDSSKPPSAAQAQDLPTKVTQDTLDLSAVARISTQARLMDLRLRECSAELNVEPQDLSSDWRDRIFNGYDSNFRGFEADRQIARISCAFICVYIEGVDPRKEKLPQYDPDNPPTFAVDAEFDLAYSLGPDVTTDEVDLSHFAFANGTHNAWPYWRELVHSFTHRMGIDPVVVGPFKLPSRHDPSQARSESGEADHD